MYLVQVLRHICSSSFKASPEVVIIGVGHCEKVATPVSQLLDNREDVRHLQGYMLNAPAMVEIKKFLRKSKSKLDTCIWLLPLLLP